MTPSPGVSRNAHAPSPKSDRVNIFLGDELHRELKVLAAKEGRPMQELIVEFIEQQVETDLGKVRRIIT